MKKELIKRIAEEANTSPNYVIFMGYRIALEITVGRQLSVKEQRRLYSFLKPIMARELGRGLTPRTRRNIEWR